MQVEESPSQALPELQAPGHGRGNGCCVRLLSLRVIRDAAMSGTPAISELIIPTPPRRIPHSSSLSIDHYYKEMPKAGCLLKKSGHDSGPYESRLAGVSLAGHTVLDGKMRATVGQRSPRARQEVRGRWGVSSKLPASSGSHLL